MLRLLFHWQIESDFFEEERNNFSHETVLWLHLLNCFYIRELCSISSLVRSFVERNPQGDRELKVHENKMKLFLLAKEKKKKKEKNLADTLKKKFRLKKEQKSIMASILLVNRTRKENVRYSLLKDICATLQWLPPTHVRVESNINCLILLIKHLSF